MMGLLLGPGIWVLKMRFPQAWHTSLKRWVGWGGGWCSRVFARVYREVTGVEQHRKVEEVTVFDARRVQLA